MYPPVYGIQPLLGSGQTVNETYLECCGLQVSGWGELANCMNTADVIGPRLHIHEDGTHAPPYRLALCPFCRQAL